MKGLKRGSLVTIQTKTGFRGRRIKEETPTNIWKYLGIPEMENAKTL